MYDVLFEQLHRLDSSLVLTPTQRLSRYLRQAYADYQIKVQQQCSWLTPTIMPLAQWLKISWQQFNQTILLLNELQEWQLWHTIIAKNPPYTSFDSQQFATLAQQAWHFIHDETISLAELETIPKLETQLFHQWANEFSQYCQQYGFISSATLPQQLLLHTAQLELPRQIHLVGFDILAKNINDLFSAIDLDLGETSSLNAEHDASASRVYMAIHEQHREDRNNAMFREHWENSKSSTAHRLACQDQQQEIINMAQWVCEQYQRQPEARIVCIVPDLLELRNSIQRIFTQTLQAELFFNPDPTANLFNISAGYRFSDAPLIQDALTLLTLPTQTLSWHHLSHLLTSPFIVAAEQEMASRARLDADLRAQQQVEFPLDVIMSIIEQGGKNFVPAFKQALLQHSQQANQHSSRLASKWLHIWQQTLQHWGWPGERTLSSEEHQQLKRWKALAYTFASLDTTQEAMQASQALTIFKQLLNTALFQPETTSSVPIQIVGLLEAAGLDSDYCWVMGLHDGAWPNAPSINPLLPFGWQSDTNIAFAQTLTQRLIQQSEYIVFSYPQYLQDQPLRPSPLITALPTIELEALLSQPVQHWSASLQAQASLENWQDDNGQLLPLNSSVAGGSRLFADQAACPFKAYATHRLRANALEPVEDQGISVLQQGSLIHQALEIIWKKLNNYNQLSNKPDDELEVVIKQAIEQAWQQEFSKQAQPPSQRLQQLEHQRLQQLLFDWLMFERERSDFTVLACEQWLTVNINGISVRLKLDRLDQLANGQQMIIDYKTGRNNSINAWFEERLQQAQLPLYAISQDHIDAISFAEVRLGNMKWRGVSGHDVAMPGIKMLDNWENMLDSWSKQLNLLAKEFLSAHARVSPVNPTVCHACNLHSFCRIYQQSALNS